jgi:UDP-N-acetylmuramate: L-alanyl-gamma-D-glutamyl-meso-diaminopimelate ligase
MEFLPQYKGTLANAPVAFVYFNPHAIELKKLKHLSKETVYEAFGDKQIEVYDNSAEMFSYIKSQNYKCPVYLLMSSGDFDGFDINSLVK